MKIDLQRAVVGVAALAVAGIAAGAAWSTAPGTNGKLAFRRYLDTKHPWGARFTANPSGSAVRQITRTPKGVLDVEPDWSPDGTAIAFQRIDLNGCGSGCEKDEVDVVRSDGSGLTRLAGGGLPAW